LQGEGEHQHAARLGDPEPDRPLQPRDRRHRPRARSPGGRRARQGAAAPRVRAVRSCARPEGAGGARLLFAALLVLLLAINGLNVVNSYVGRDFMTAIEERSMPRFVAKALLYVGVFAA